MSLSRGIESVGLYPSTNFLRISQAAAMDASIIAWCKVFGARSPETNPSHYSNVFPERADEIRSKLIQATKDIGMDYETNHSEVLSCRNNATAHHSFADKIEMYPRFDGMIVTSICLLNDICIHGLRESHFATRDYPYSKAKFDEQVEWHKSDAEIAQSALLGSSQRVREVY